MEKVSKQLMSTFWLATLLEIIIVVCYETNLMLEGGFAGNVTAEFIMVTVMELLTIIMIPIALKMIKYGAVRNIIKREGASGYYRVAMMRMCMIFLPMLVNTLCYYLFMNVAFVYMAIVLAISAIFVYPSKNRCEAETCEE